MVDGRYPVQEELDLLVTRMLFVLPCAKCSNNSCMLHGAIFSALELSIVLSSNSDSFKVAGPFIPATLASRTEAARTDSVTGPFCAFLT